MADSFKEQQARKARALAEKCFLAGNVPGARRWVQSAARLAPDLPGTTQAAAAYDVHAAAARRPDDWYAVLGLARPRSSSGATLAHGDIKRQHRRLCLLVHPDKNPSAAADGAFKLVQAAWEALSAMHPPAADARTTNAAAAPACPSRRRPDPPPQPQTRRRRPPTKPRGPRQERGASHADAARAPQAARRSVSSGCCPSCGALTSDGERTLRCMVCHWSPMDYRWQVDDDNDECYL